MLSLRISRKCCSNAFKWLHCVEPAFSSFAQRFFFAVVYDDADCRVVVVVAVAVARLRGCANYT